jgi:hypothetical protein
MMAAAIASAGFALSVEGMRGFGGFPGIAFSMRAWLAGGHARWRMPVPKVVCAEGATGQRPPLCEGEQAC